VPLTEAWAVALEVGLPVRRFASRKGQRHLSGWWWSATTGAHVGFESWLERDHLMALDFDPAVVGIASQPFRLHWTDNPRTRANSPHPWAQSSRMSYGRSADTYACDAATARPRPSTRCSPGS
jgi:hypothetical protein